MTTEPEDRYRDLLAVQTGGRTEVPLAFGRCDVLTDDLVFEVEPLTRWRVGVAQALQYAAQVKQAGALAVYGDPARLEEAFTKLAELPPPGLELWYFADGTFVRVDSAEDARSHVPVPVIAQPEPRPEWTPLEDPKPKVYKPRTKQEYNAATFADHSPDLSEEQIDRLRSILQPTVDSMPKPKPAKTAPRGERVAGHSQCAPDHRRDSHTTQGAS
jgi:hypothetical protein